MLHNYLLKARKFVLLILLFSVQILFAQTASDYKLSTTTTPSTCAKNGTITMNVTKADGSELDMSNIEKIEYDVRKAGTDISETGGFKVTNVATQLEPGDYDVYVIITHKNAVKVELTAKNVNIANQYVPLVLAKYGYVPTGHAAASSSSSVFFEKGMSQYSLNCVPTGAYNIQVTARTGSKYTIHFIEKPAEYAGADITSVSANRSYIIKNLPAGTYKIQIFNDCESLAFHTFTILNVPSDLPTNTAPYQMSVNLCGPTSSFAFEGYGTPQLLRYRLPTLTSELYHTNYSRTVYTYFYEFFVATRADSTALADGSLSLNDVTWSSAGTYTYPTPLTYGELADPNEPRTPVRLYFRLKNNTNPESTCQPVFIPLTIPTAEFKEGTFSQYSNWDCQEYTISWLEPRNFKGVCHVKHDIFEVDDPTNVTDTTVPFDTYEGNSYASWHNGKKFDPDKTYWDRITITDYLGVKHIYWVKLQKPTATFLGQRNFKATIGYPNCGSSMGYISIDLDGYHKGATITLVSAPAEYKPDPHPLAGREAMKVNQTITLPDDYSKREFYPTNYDPVTLSSEYNEAGLIELPEGEYVFRISHKCAPTEEKILKLKSIRKTRALIQKILINDDNVEKEPGCGHVKIYPFRKGITDYVVDQNDIPQSVLMKFYINDVYKKSINFNPASINLSSHKDFYIEAPKAEVDMRVEYITSEMAYAYSWNASPNPRYVECMLTNNKFKLTFQMLTYDRDTYYGYRCQGGTTAYMGIKAINGIGPYTYVLKDMSDQVLKTVESVPAGTLAKFDFTGLDISSQYKMTIKDDHCPGEEVYEDIFIADLTASLINPYLRKICTSETPESKDISPINGKDGVLAEGMMSYTWTIKSENTNILGLEGSDMPQPAVMSGKLSLVSDVFVPQTAIYEVIPYYGTCPGQPFDITLVVSPCINYWQGGVDNLWNREDNWTENTVPKIDEDVEFATNENNPPFVGIPKSGPAVRDLHVPVGDAKKIGSLINRTDLATIIPAEASLTVNNSIIGSETQEQAHKLVVGAEADKANGTLIVTKGCGHNIYGTVQLYGKGVKGPKGEWTDNIDGSPTKGRTFYSEYEWQYFGVPVASIVASPTFYGASLRKYDETYNGDKSQFYQKWHWLNDESTLTAFTGYSITQPTAKTYSIAGKLEFCGKDITMTRQAVPVTDATGNAQNIHYGLGQNLFGNSYTAAIDISKLNLPTNVEQTIYMYNTGRFHDWADRGVRTEDNTQRSAGNWFAIPQETAQAVWNNEIPSMQGFMLKFTDEELAKGVGENQIINIPYATTEGELKVLPNTKPQLAPGKVTSQTTGQEPLSYLRVNLESASTRDALWLISQEGTTNRFDNGWDGRKYFGTPTAFIFTENKDGLMQVNADKTIDGSIISFYANADTEYELTMIKSNLDQYADLHLHDLVTKTSVSLDTDTTYYSFTGINQGNVEKRFVILNSSELNLKDGSISLLDAYLKYNELLIVSNLSGKEGEVGLYDTTGRRILSKEMPTGVIEIPVTLGKGIYIVNMQVEGSRETVKIVVK